MRWILSIFILLLCCQYSISIASQWGPGSTTTTCIDWDSDGYGVGPGCSGADGDDSDASVHTAAQIISKHSGGTSASGGLSVFLSTVKGYNPTNYYFVSTTGSDSTGVANDPDHPWATVSGLRVDHALVAGDIVIIKGGTYTDNWSLSYPTTSGSSGNPIIFMAYPGEKPTWDLPGDFGGEPTEGNSHLVFDGLLFTNSATSLGRTFNFGANDGTDATGIIIRNCEVWARANGAFMMQDLHSILIERNVFHHTEAGGSHGIYLGARNYPNDDVIIRNNLIYQVGLTCAQMNGRCTNYELSGNVCYNFKNASGFSLEMGVEGAIVYNNIVFNGTREPLVIYNYPPPNQISLPGVLPRDMTNNVIEHNTFIVSDKVYYDGTENGAIPNIKFANTTPQEIEDIWSNTIRNNILANFAGGVLIQGQTQQGTYTPCIAGSCDSTMDYIDSTTTHLSYRANGEDPTEHIKSASINGNLMYSSSPNNIMRFYNIASACNTPLNTPPGNIDTTLNWSQFAAHSASFTDNINEDPILEDTTASYYNNPGNFDFRPSASSPALRAGVATSITTDIEGKSRDSSNPTIGAYDFAFQHSMGTFIFGNSQ